MNAYIFKVYCYRGQEKQIWYEAEDAVTRQGVAWSPSRRTCESKAKKLGYQMPYRMVVKFYRAKSA